jgi:S1-C subfamily serine protease
MVGVVLSRAIIRIAVASSVAVAAMALGGCSHRGPAGGQDASESAVQVIAVGCATADVHGAGLMVGPGRVATVAHVVAGAERVSVRGVHGTSDATVVYFDPDLDLAVLKVDPRLAPPVPLADAGAGDTGLVTVYRKDVPTQLAAAVQRVVDIRTEDIYGAGKHLRPGYELQLDLQPGDSGSVLVVGGNAVAISWATSQNTEGRSWAMKATLVAGHLDASAPVDHGHCA